LNAPQKDVNKNFTTNGNVSDQFSYDENTILVGKRQKLHIVSRFFGRTLQATDGKDGIHKAAIDCTFEVPLGMEGVYFVIAHAILHFITDDGILRVDMAAAIPGNVLQYSPPPEVKTITKGFKIGFGIVLSFFLVLQIGTFAYIIHKRSHPVLKISQANFLAMLVACTILVTISCIFLLPTKDINCTLQGPFILIPLTTMASILVGRLWRAYSMLSVVLSMGKGETPRRTSSARIMNILASMADWRMPKYFQRWCSRKTQRRRSTKAGLRTAVLESDLYRLVFLLTLPQLLLQVLAIAFLPGEVEIEFNEDESMGRTVCKRDLQTARWVGDLYLMLLLVLSVIVAWICRDLPSLFNEKDAIFNAAGITTFITFLTVCLLIIIDEPSTSPNATVLLWTFMTLGVSTTISWLIIAPKIRLVRSGYNFDFSTIFSSTGQKPHAWSENSTNLNDKEKKVSDGQVVAPTINSPTQNIKSRIWLKDRDTPPQAILAQLLSTKGAIEQVTESSLQGHLVSQQEWTMVHVETGELLSQLDQLEFVDESQHAG